MSDTECYIIPLVPGGMPHSFVLHCERIPSQQTFSFDDVVENDIKENNEDDSQKDVFKVCAICLDEVKKVNNAVKYPTCSHIYHKNCLIPWLEKKTTCPQCVTRFPKSHISCENEHGDLKRDVSKAINNVLSKLKGEGIGNPAQYLSDAFRTLSQCYNPTTIQHVMQHTAVTREVAIDALEDCGGNSNNAINHIFSENF